MKQVLFINTHIGSGSDYLYQSLDDYSRIQGYSGNFIYENAESLLNLTLLPHKCRNNGAIYLDRILYNHTIKSRDVYKIPDHIFMVREPEGTLGEIGDLMGWDSAARYYRLRLRRLVSIAKSARHGIFIDYRELQEGSGWNRISDHLQLKSFSIPKIVELNKVDVPYALIVECRNTYEWCTYAMKSLGFSEGKSRFGSIA